MAYQLRINSAESDLCGRTTMTAEGLAETTHLESWIKLRSEVIDDALIVGTTQFGSWASETGSARERPDILALYSSGELVVTELKRGTDQRIHLQALTYGAFVAGFTSLRTDHRGENAFIPRARPCPLNSNAWSEKIPYDEWGRRCKPTRNAHK